MKENKNRMKWESLLTDRRHVSDENADCDNKSKSERNPFEIDYDRILFSESFRRMQSKTQVHTFAKNDHVHNRLTHSVEVASTARSLGVRAGNFLRNRNELSKVKDVKSNWVGDVLQAAALAHDIGNPPFGHQGESAVQEWFKKEYGKDDESEKKGEDRRVRLSDEQVRDFFAFDGNAQGFRILTRLENHRHEGGLRLTAATLATYTKYPRSSSSLSHAEEFKQRKPGFFQDDKDEFERVAENCGLLRKGEQRWCRHPLSFLLEAADDICYITVDIEDAVELGVLKKEDARERLLGFVKNRYKYQDYPLRSVRAKVIGILIESAFKSFEENYEKIMQGKFDGGDGLLLGSSIADEYVALKQFSRDVIYSARQKSIDELAGRKVIHGLLKNFSLIVCPLRDVDFKRERLKENKNAEVAKRLASVLEEKDFLWERVSSEYKALLCISDYISGMTDRSASELYRSLQGYFDLQNK